jgi:hypothetical protein
VVYGRTLNEEVTSFGTTGYTFDNVFLLYDRATDSVWYPIEPAKLTAVGGTLRGQSIPVLHQPKRVTLKTWLRDHPDTLVLLGDESEVDRIATFNPDSRSK